MNYIHVLVTYVSTISVHVLVTYVSTISVNSCKSVTELLARSKWSA